MKRFVVFLLISISIIAMSSGLEITKKIRVVILPAQTSHSWLKADVDFLLSMLEEAMTDLGRFEVYSRSHVKEIMKERGLAQMGMTDLDAEKLGKLAGAQYVILLTLNNLDTGISDGKYWASAQLSIRLLDISSGEVVATKSIDYNTGSYYKSPDEAKKALFEYIKSEFVIVMRKFFKLKAFVVKVENGKAYLKGVDPNLLKVGMVFKVEGGLGRSGYVKVEGEENGYVVADVLYGYVRPGLQAKEMALLGGGGAISLNYYGGFTYSGVSAFGIGVTSWKGLYVEASYLVGSVLNYVPFDAVLGMRFNLMRFGRVYVGAHGGADMFGIYDTDREDIVAMVFGADVGVDGRYEFDPTKGIFLKADYKYLMGIGGFKAFSVGYYMGF